MNLAKNLKYLRLKNGFSQDYIADKLGYKSYTTIQKWEMGVSEPSLAVLSTLSKLYNVDMDTMCTANLENEERETNRDYNKIPLLGTIAAGLPILAQENIETYFNIDSSIRADFALRIKGDSMVDIGILPGDIAFVKQQPELENGEIGAILIDDSATLKKFYKEKGTVILQAENRNYKPIVLHNGNVKILGKLTAALSVKE